MSTTPTQPIDEQQALAGLQALFSGRDTEIADLKASTQAAQDALLKAQQDLAAAQATIPAVAFTKLERETWLVGAGTVANSNQTGSTASSFKTTPGPGLATFGLTPDGPWADKYFFVRKGALNEIVRWAQRGSLFLPTAADAADSQAIEFDLPQTVSNTRWNWGGQLDFAEGKLRIWNHEAGAWEPQAPLTRLAPLKWYDVELKVHRDGNSVIYDSFEINGLEELPAPVTFNAVPKVQADLLNFGFQLDGEKVPNAYQVMVSDFELIGWTA